MIYLIFVYPSASLCLMGVSVPTIDLCRDRILSRIRSQREDVRLSWRNRDKRFSGSSLEAILSAVRDTFHDTRIRPDVNSFICQVEKLLKALNEVESSETGRVKPLSFEIVEGLVEYPFDIHSSSTPVQRARSDNQVL